MHSVIGSLLSVFLAFAVPSPADPPHGAPPGGAPSSSGPSSSTPLSFWPVPGVDGGRRPAVDRPYEPPPEPWRAGHRGVDLRAPAGARVRAAGAGRVTFAGQVAGRGVVTVELDASGTPPVRITHEPVTPSVTAGDRVEAGSPLGVLAAGPHHCADPCLHWGATRDGTYLDPLALLRPGLLRAGPSRLLPTTGVPVPGASA
ncbi:M23 family metallopeptidase [Streptomyces avicenniae]|uniref:M23 family metallopeptidase n=1 Tax=Streptomyces avicenniae TaxID=500153 RepID=UPI000B2724D8|nr:peptidoglycan DD-metalloendopeptidase family protein [Streptomyces avicenniae]